MSSSGSLFWTYLAGVLAVAVILAALGVSMVIYQRRFLSLHRDYAQKLVAAHEEERAYVAREVHDDALQRVAMLQHDVIQWIDAQPAGATADRSRAEAVRRELEDLGVMLRRVAHRLHPAIIEQGGLLPALSQLADDASRVGGMRVATKFAATSHQVLLGREKALSLFRIAQEALRNTAKHSGAKAAEIAVEFTKDELAMTIADTGQGFDLSDARHAAGLGMISMKERARLADGKIDVWSKPGTGTTIRVTVPRKD